MSEKIIFEKINESFLEVSFIWFQDLDLREMTLSSGFTREDQARWFASLPEREDYFIKGVKYDGRWIGAFGLKNINYDKGCAEYFGYIAEKTYRGQGFGTIMLRSAIDYSRRKLLNLVYLRVRGNNIGAKRLYQKFGFEVSSSVEGVLSMELSLNCERESYSIIQ